MATLRPLFRTFLSRSKLLGSSTLTGDRSSTWPLGRRANRGGYYRSGSGNKEGQEELGLRSDLRKGVGVTTTIKSNGEMERKSSRENQISRSASQNGLNWLDNETPLKDDSSEEFLPVQKPPGNDWAVRKTTEVTTSQELENGRAGR